MTPRLRRTWCRLRGHLAPYTHEVEYLVSIETLPDGSFVYHPMRDTVIEYVCPRCDTDVRS